MAILGTDACTVFTWPWRAEGKSYMFAYNLWKLGETMPKRGAEAGEKLFQASTKDFLFRLGIF